MYQFFVQKRSRLLKHSFLIWLTIKVKLTIFREGTIKKKNVFSVPSNN